MEKVLVKLNGKYYAVDSAEMILEVAGKYCIVGSNGCIRRVTPVEVGQIETALHEENGSIIKDGKVCGNAKTCTSAGGCPSAEPHEATVQCDEVGESCPKCKNV